jgi:hypothetical protein
VEFSLRCHGFKSSMVHFWHLIEFIWKSCHHKINFAQIIIFSKGMLIIYNILEKLNCTSYILTSIKFIIQLKFYIILIIYINFLAFYRKKIQTCLRPPKHIGLAPPLHLGIIASNEKKDHASNLQQQRQYFTHWAHFRSTKTIMFKHWLERDNYAKDFTFDLKSPIPTRL